MKIHVIDNAGKISPLLLVAEAEVAFYDDEIQALNAVEQEQPELVFLNIDLRGTETADYVRLLLSASSSVRIVVIGESACEIDIFRCLLAGAKGYQDSQQLPAYINKIIRVISEGEAWISRKMVAGLLDAIRQSQL